MPEASRRRQKVELTNASICISASDLLYVVPEFPRDHQYRISCSIAACSGAELITIFFSPNLDLKVRLPSYSY